jgi:hypothetical protein
MAKPAAPTCEQGLKLWTSTMKSAVMREDEPLYAMKLTESFSSQVSTQNSSENITIHYLTANRGSTLSTSSLVTGHFLHVPADTLLLLLASENDTQHYQIMIKCIVFIPQNHLENTIQRALLNSVLCNAGLLNFYICM